MPLLSDHFASLTRASLLMIAIMANVAVEVCAASPNAKPEFKALRLSKPVQTTDIPPYRGKKVDFVVGTLFPSVKGGPSVTMEFATQDNPKQVLDWYKQAFRQYSWTALDNMTGANGVAAMRDHNICQIMTSSPARPGAKCDFLVRYKFYKADSTP